MAHAACLKPTHGSKPNHAPSSRQRQLRPALSWRRRHPQPAQARYTGLRARRDIAPQPPITHFLLRGGSLVLCNHREHRNPRIAQRGVFKSKNMFRKRLVEYTHGEPSSFVVVDGPDAAVLVNHHHFPFGVTSLFGTKDSRGFRPGKCAAAAMFRYEVVSPFHETRRCIVALASNDGSC